MLEEFDDSTDESAETTRRPRRRMSRRRRVAVSVLAFLLLVVIGIGGYGWFISSKVDRNLTREDLIGEQDTEGLVDDKGENYLLIGSDTRPGDAGRADVIQLIHVDEAKEKIWIIHFPRDLYVPIPDHGEDKINAAYAYGKSPLLVSTIQDLVGVKIDHVAQTDFEGFVELTDALGGVTVQNEQASPKYPKGTTELDGDNALEFVRERKTLEEGDISRGQRQQAWLKGIMTKTLTPGVLLNPNKLSNVIDAGTEHTVVDKALTGGEIRSQALGLRGVRGGDIRFVTAPFDGFGTSPEGASIDILDEEGMENLAEALQDDHMESYDQ